MASKDFYSSFSSARQLHRHMFGQKLLNAVDSGNFKEVISIRGGDIVILFSYRVLDADFVLRYIDDLSADEVLNIFTRLRRETDGERYDWTNRDTSHKYYLSAKELHYLLLYVADCAHQVHRLKTTGESKSDFLIKAQSKAQSLSISDQVSLF